MDNILDKFEANAKKVIEHFKNELCNIRAGRANPNILNKICIDYYGTQTPINQISAISVPEARVITIIPFDPSQIKQISKAIITSDIGITPNDDGKIIRLIFPQLTEDKRRELVKQIKKLTEDMKVSLRTDRRQVMDNVKKLQKDGEITKDEVQEYDSKILKLLDKKVEELEKLFKEKEKEIMEI